MIVSRPVLEVLPPPDFALWLVIDATPYDFLPLHGGLASAEIGTAIASIAQHNAVAPEENRPPASADPLDDFLRGLLTTDRVHVPGGLRVTDTGTGFTLLPGCCTGLEERGDWLEVLDGNGWACFGHDPSPVAERVGDAVRLTVDEEGADSAVTEVRVDELRRSLGEAELDLIGFLHLAAVWAAEHVPDHAQEVTEVLARALGLPAPALPAPALPAPRADG
ncbi:hypothetical protein CW362_39080 [Streptomyces populi]|uniref:Uncharacterized protein n=1 Tax=Streptomyces populi TaxID=2058924 RepID=A0A2I0SCQ0_9ACTN|nr:hypothetical protein [Streptomyces populi]PKT67694.1 hypothetical protein CW362_39080 [Streptomyces populi]